MLSLSQTSLISLNEPKSPVSEAYRVLRTNIQFSGIDRKLKTIVVTSAGPGEGKSVTTANIAVTFAQNGSRTLIIDADLRKPRVHKLFEIRSNKGLTNVLALHEDYKEYVQHGPVNNLDILTCGAIPPNPSELLSSNSMKTLLETVSEDYEHIFIDAPPVGVVTDAAILSTIVDGTMLVVAAGETQTDHLQRAKEMLDRVNANIIGAVLNKLERSTSNSYYYYYYYHNEDSLEMPEGLQVKRKGKRRRQ